MKQISENLPKKTREKSSKRTKVHRTAPEIARKIIAFEELLNCKKNQFSERATINLLDIPKSTIRSWQKQKNSKLPSNELTNFIETQTGKDFIQKVVVAGIIANKCGSGGVKGMQDFLRNSGLNFFVASSAGALQDFWVRCGVHILKYGAEEEKRLAQYIKNKEITVGLDELFRGRKPCLVAIEVVSNYILLAKFTSDRKATSWRRELDIRMGELGTKIFQVVSDLCGAIRSYAKSIKAIHSPDLFHGQYEISKATAGSLSSQERAAETALKKADEVLIKLLETPSSSEKKAEEKQDALLDNAKKRMELVADYAEKKDRREKVKAANRKIGEIHRPINLETGELQSEEIVRTNFKDQVNIVKKCAKEAKLAKPCEDRIEKAERAFEEMATYMKNFFIVFFAFIRALGLTSQQEEFFKEVIFPLCYLRSILRRAPAKKRAKHQRLLRILEEKLCESPWVDNLKEEWMEKGMELSESFQRSSSCVEGSNGMLSLLHHRFHRLSENTLRVISIIQNFYVRRPDNTTAAQRFFGAEHKDLFESLVANVRIPGKPQRQVRKRGKQCAA